MNMIDGFQPMIGSFVMNTVLIFVMLMAVRAPTFEDDAERTTEALYTYIYLIVYHLALAAVSYCNSFLSKYWRKSITVWMLIVVITQVMLCTRWIYNNIYDSDFK